MTCSRCGQPLGIITYTVTAWVGERSVAETVLCPPCAGIIVDPNRTPEHYRPELGPG